MYIVRTLSGKLYTGITTNLARRWEEHRLGAKGAKFFRISKPQKIVYREEVRNRSEASLREAAIKAMSRAQKLKLIDAASR